jgi:hypothetical protein
MNIFILDLDIVKCCEYMVDKHIVKMQLESAQLLSTAVRLSGINTGYNITHVNHPCSLWTRSSIDNWLWLRELALQMHEEYRYRYGENKTHLSWLVTKSLPIPNLPQIGYTNFAQAMPYQYIQSNPVLAYRSYYIHEKQHLAQWTNRQQPTWWK